LIGVSETHAISFSIIRNCHDKENVTLLEKELLDGTSPNKKNKNKVENIAQL